MEAIKQTVAQNLGVSGAHELVPEHQQFSLEQTPDLSGKVAVITGGSEGIGYGCSHTLLSHNIAKVFIISLSKDVVDGTVKAIEEEMGEEAAKKVEWLQCDLADWNHVLKTADTIAKGTDRVDIIINNAARGIMTYQVTDLGVDRHMAANHVGHVLLTSRLLPILKDTASKGNIVRIVNLASNLHEFSPPSTQFLSLDELNQDIGPNPQYGRSKLAAILYARYLERHLTSEFPGILANATHPGVVNTKMSLEDIHEPYPLGGYGMSAIMKPFKKSAEQGCVSTVFAATTTDKSGQYICPPAVVEQGSKQSQDIQLGEQLMKLTRDLVRTRLGEDLKDY